MEKFEPTQPQVPKETGAERKEAFHPESLKVFRFRHGSTEYTELRADVQREFNQEVPSSLEIKPVMKARKYHSIKLPENWMVI